MIEKVKGNGGDVDVGDSDVDVSFKIYFVYVKSPPRTNDLTYTSLSPDEILTLIHDDDDDDDDDDDGDNDDDDDDDNNEG
uniref:Uncharacterized protein n=1 Tax=Vespula pensylvanica TaxID=30213 RepID=A0A834NLR7_VESPE|nr:hypothetical protein H0235_012745 [Vespula pensylvanica]